MSKSNDSDAIMQRVVAAVKAANVPDYVISGMISRLPNGKWPVNMAGSVPDRELFVIAALCKTNTAGCEAGFHTGEMRREGMSLRELSGAFNCGPAHNHSVSISQGTTRRPGAGYFWRESMGDSRWRMTFTPKGEKYIMAKLAGVAAQVTAASEKPTVKPKGQAQLLAGARKATSKPKGKVEGSWATKVAPTNTLTSEPANVTVSPEVNQAEIQPELEPVIETVQLGGVDAEHDQVTPDQLAGLAEHFNS